MFIKIYNIVRQAISKGQTTQEGYIPYFDSKGDNFPLKWAKLISESPSATSCLNTLNSFVQGYGFNDEELEKLIVDSKGGTLFQLHQKTVRDFNQNEGFYWLLRYDTYGKISEVELLPFENCRLGKPDDSGYISKIFYNPFFGTKEYAGGNKKHTKEYDVYNPDGVKSQIAAQKDKYKGQVFFFGTTTTMSRYYPINKAYSCSKWMGIEAGVADYHEDSINNGFLNDYILIQRGNPNAPSTNPDYAGTNSDRPTTVAEEFDQVMTKNFLGRGKQNNVMVQWVENPDEKPEILQIPTKANGDLFVTLDNQATKKITVGWSVPAILANISEGVRLGGDANTIRVAVKLMQQRVVDTQRILTDSYSTILKNFYRPYTEDISIVPYNPYPELEVLDDKIWNALTPDEQRRWIQDNTELDLEGNQTTEQHTIVPNAKFVNAVPIAFPEEVKTKVKKTLEYVDKMGLKCGGKSGREVSEAILSNNSMGMKQLKRIHAYLKKRERFANSLNNEGCDVIEYNSWGGKEMFDFLEAKLSEYEQWLN